MSKNESRATASPAPASAGAAAETQALARLHLRAGWWTLAFFLLLGLVLEGLHAVKADLYLNVANQTRRMMWTLAHAHGSLLGVINVAFAFTVERLPGWSEAGRARLAASRALLASTLLIPLGFFLGGLLLHAGDPGLGVLLVPPGGALAVLAAYLTARACRR
jgi:hypothetical protein